MEVDSPESPPVSSPSSPVPEPEEIPVEAEEGEVDEEQNNEQELDLNDKEDVSDLEDVPSKDLLSSNLTEKYRSTQRHYDVFYQLSSSGDVQSIYRGRNCFITKTTESLIEPALNVFYNIPSSRGAVYNLVGLYIHEYTHHTFGKRENSPNATSTTSLEEANKILLRKIQNYIESTDSKHELNKILAWACNLFAELSTNNEGRPSMLNCQQPDTKLKAFIFCDAVTQLISLLNSVITALLEKAPESCMKELFHASRHGHHFNWIWLHIAITFSGSIITHLLATGAKQFKCYVEEVNNKQSQNTAAQIMTTMHNEYQLKFSAVSDVFNFLMRKRNPELQEVVSKMILESLNSQMNEDLSFAFFFKLVTCSMETLMILITNNTKLITPWNVIRAIRQILTMDKTIILANLQYTEFIRRVVDVIDPVTHGVVFEVLTSIIYDRKAFDGENDPTKTEENKNIIKNCSPILDVMMNRIVRIAHATGPTNCPSQHPSISAFSYGEKLQFIIDSIANHVDRSSTIIRHLHAIAIANGEVKAAEIVMRFIITIGFDSPKYIYVLMAFITTTGKFFPNMMDYMYQEFFALKTLTEMSLTEESEKATLHMNMLNNLRVLFEWEAASDDTCHVSYLRIYSGEFIGNVLNILLSDSIKIVHETYENGETEQSLTVLRMTTKLIEAVCAVNSPKPKSRKFLASLSNWYKLMGQLAILLKSSLLFIGRRENQGITVFEELRTAVMSFLYCGHIDEQMKRFVSVFSNLFVTSCFLDSKRLFGEIINENIDKLIEERGLNKMNELKQLEDGPSVLDTIRSIRMSDSALDMMHSGQLKRRRNNDMKRNTEDEESEEIQKEDEKQRVFVVLDALRAMCRTGAQEIQLENGKQIAIALVEIICKDTLAADMKFDEWDIETENIHRYVETDRKINQSVLCDGILRILSETRSFAYCLPIMKAQLAVIINDAEKNANRRKCSDVMRTKLHRWMLLANRSGLIPQRFAYVCDLEYFTNSHETFLMLLEIWRFLIGRGLSIILIDQYHTELLSGNVDEGLPNEKEAFDRSNFDVYRIILQNHIADAYHLFPKLFSVEYDFLKLSTIE